MSKFKIGDRVRVYDSYQILQKMFVVGHFPDGTLKLAEKPDSDKGFSAWPQQCRRLAKKKRHEFWLMEMNGGESGKPFTDYSQIFFSKDGCEKTGSLRYGFLRAVKFREVKE